MATVPNKKNAPVKSRPTGLLTWIVVGVVVIAVAGFVVAKVATSTKAGSSSAISATMAAEIGQLPASLYDTVGINSPSIPVTPPTLAKNQPLLSATSASGVKLPQVVYYGAEYCPFCAAQRWAAILALSRFGTFTGLRTSFSSPTDVYPNTPTFTFVHSTYSSKYLVFTSVETQDVNRKSLQTPTKLENYLLSKYDVAPYFPSQSASSLSIPFMDFGNQFLTSGASFNPGVLAGQTREQIAAGLKSPSSPITQAIVAAANFQTAAICKLTGNKPGNVCNASGVKAAARKLSI